MEKVSEKSRLVATLLCAFLSGLGVHRFYVGKITSGVIMILFGWLTFGIWHIIDLILIITGQFKDSEGNIISDWQV